MNRLLAFFLALSCSAPLAAEQLPSRTRGLSADSVYQVGDLDQINEFNGNLSLTIPIGQSYPVSPQLSYRLTLVYNSNVWDYDDEESCLQNNQPRAYNFPYLNKSSNAGEGWSLHFGRLFAPNDTVYNRDNGSWLFVGPDGSQHNFYARLHPGESTLANVFYSLDGTYLRLDARSASKIIESPDGVKRTFALADGRYRLTDVADRFGNWMHVEYTTTSWTISDSHGRSHVVTTTAPTLEKPVTQVTKVDLDSFGGDEATYTFTYTPASIERHLFDREPCDTNNEHTEFQSGQLLTSLALPDGTGYAFTYSTNDSTSTSFSGAMRSAKLPTGGRVEWDYTTYIFQSQAPTIQQSSRNRQRGIGARRTYLVDAQGDHLQGSWDYDYIESLEETGPTGPFLVSCWHRMRVSDNISSTVTDSYFATAEGPDQWWYGLPYAPCDPLTLATTVAPWSAGNSAPYLSTRVYERESDGDLNPIRSTYVIYDSDGPEAGPRQDRNHRLRYQKVVYHDDKDGSGNPHWEETVNSDFDGLGHYRGVSRSSSFGSTKSVATAFLPSGTYQLNPDTRQVVTDTFSMPSVSDPWINGLSSDSITSQGAAVSKRETCFDTSTGALLRQRQLAGSNQAGKDLLVEFELADDVDGNGGFVVAERLYGGDDLQNSPGGSLCEVELGGETPAFVKLSSYQYAGVTRSAWVEPCAEGTEVLVEAEATIDKWTGLAQSVVETNGIGVALDYDKMGRLLSEVPDEGASRVHKYVPGGPKPSYEVNHCPQGEAGFCGPGSRLDNRYWDYDSLGRLARQALAFPAAGGGDATPSRKNTLDGLGRMTEEWTWNDAKKTAFSDFDTFGRARTLTPEGSYPTYLTFKGVRLKSREVKVATGQGTVASAYATELSDHLGRLVAVCDGASNVWDGGNATCTGQLTRYSYDQNDHLVKVCQNVDSNGSCGQSRFFAWDGRGFLMAETHPEIGAGGNGTINYKRDARGNPTERDVANDGGDRPLRFTYDRAGRTVRVEEQAATAGWRVIKEFFYARNDPPSGGERRRGQLVMARRTNWVLIPGIDTLPERTVPLVVTDHYQYFGLGGRVSKKTTSIALPSGSQAFTTELEYDPLGNVDSIEYPVGDWPLNYPPPRQVTWNRRLGYLTSIPGYATALRYQLGGMPYEIEYANGVTWRQTAEAATGWERPDNIQTLTSGGVSLWSTGDYSYDGAGNISAIGDRTNVYDKFSRFAYVHKSGVAQHEQQATYDAYGNLTALARNGVARTLTTDPATNRLTASGAEYTSNGEMSKVTIDLITFKYGYDGLGQQMFQRVPGKSWVFAYDANDERILSWECAGNSCGEGTNFERYTLRGLGGEVLRVFEGPSRSLLEWKEDYVYRDGQPLAWVKALDAGGEQKLFLHADHLESTRLVTNTAGQQVSRHDFLPFGEESTASTSGDIALKFTGHERDQPGKAHDYMHARFYNSQLGRFLSPDPVGGWQSTPQTWNLFSYVIGNPLKYVDPTGLSMICISTSDGEVCTVTESEIPLQELTDLVDSRVRVDNLTREDFAREVARESWSKTGWISEGGDKVLPCAAQQLGLYTAAGTTAVAAGQPWVAKRFVTPGSSGGTSLASSTLSQALPQKLPRAIWAPTTVRPFGTSNVVGRVLGRWVPFVGWALLANDAIGVARCVGE